MVISSEEHSLEVFKINSKWYNKSYAGYLLGIYEQGLAAMYGATKGKYKEISPTHSVIFVNQTRKDHWDWFWDASELKANRNKILSLAEKNPHFIDTFLSDWKKEYAAFIKFYKKVDLEKIVVEPDRKAKNILVKLHELYCKEAALGYVVDNFLSDEGDWLVDAIKSELGAKADSQTVETLTLPVYASFVNESEIELLGIALQIRKKTSIAKINSQCKKYSSKYFWIKTNYLDFKGLTPQEVLLEAQNLEKSTQALEEKIKEDKTRILLIKKMKASVLKKYSISKKLKAIIHASEAFTYIQDKRKECVLKSNNIFLNEVFALSKTKKFDSKLSGYLTFEELFELLSGKELNWAEILKRYNEGVAAVFINGGSRMVPHEKYAEYFAMQNFFKDLGVITEIKGSVAFKGKVRGIVRVLKNTKHIGLFGEGLILVANQTTPEYVPAMKKAAAVVTDQGGITCHAAIVARELKIPCVIGTKIATKVLKDGDLVEVDANLGIIKILSPKTN